MTAALEGAPVQIGQTLYAVSRRGGSYEEFKVEKIGRKWITLDREYRCTIDTLMLDCGGYAPRQLYRTIEEHAEQAMLSAAWADFKRDTSSLWRCPPGLTVESINAIRAQLGLKVLEATHAA